MCLRFSWEQKFVNKLGWTTKAVFVMMFSINRLSAHQFTLMCLLSFISECLWVDTRIFKKSNEIEQFVFGSNHVWWLETSSELEYNVNKLTNNTQRINSLELPSWPFSAFIELFNFLFCFTAHPHIPQQKLILEMRTSAKNIFLIQLKINRMIKTSHQTQHRSRFVSPKIFSTKFSRAIISWIKTKLLKIVNEWKFIEPKSDEEFHSIQRQQHIKFHERWCNNGEVLYRDEMLWKIYIENHHVVSLPWDYSQRL